MSLTDILKQHYEEMMLEQLKRASVLFENMPKLTQPELDRLEALRELKRARVQPFIDELIVLLAEHGLRYAMTEDTQITFYEKDSDVELGWVGDDGFHNWTPSGIARKDYA